MNDDVMLDKLADIELPTPPDWSALLMPAGITMVIAVISCWLAWRFYKTSSAQRKAAIKPAPAQQARQLLIDLRATWAKHAVNDREASYRLATLLRLGLGLDQLTSTCPASIVDNSKLWQTTISTLQQQRYQPASAARLTPELFDLIDTWLGHHALQDGQRQVTTTGS